MDSGVESYKRPVFWKLWFLRSVYIGLVTLTIWLFFGSHADYTVLTIISLLFLSAVRMTGLVVKNGSVFVYDHYCSGIISKKTEFRKNDIVGICSKDDTYEHNIIGDTITAFDHMDEHPSILMSLLSIFWPGSETTVKVYVIDFSVVKKDKKINRRVIVSEQESEILKEFYSKQRRRGSL